MPRAAPDGADSERTPLLRSESNIQREDQSNGHRPGSQDGANRKGQSNGAAGDSEAAKENDKSKYEKTTTQKAIILAALFTGNLLFSMDGSIVTTLAPTIASQFGAAQLATSLGTYFLASSAAFSPIWGKVSDITGRRAMLIGPTIVFGLSTLGCAVANSMEFLLFCRLVAGIGGSGILATGQVVMSDLVSQRKRGLLQGVSNTVFAVGFSIGGPVGGFINDALGWRAIFWLQVPLIVIVLAAYAIFIDIPLPFMDYSLTRWQRFKRIDWLGSATIMASIFLIIAGLSLGGNVVEWNEWPVFVTLGAGVVGIGIFLWIEARVAAVPILALDILFTRTVATTAIANLLQAVAVFVGVFQLPYYYLVVLNLTPSQAGIRYFPQSIALAVGSLLGGQLVNRTGRYRPTLPIFCSIMILTPVLIAATWIPNAESWSKNDWRYYAEITFIGFGNGACLPAILVACIASVKYEQMATVSSVNSFTRAIGQVLGVSLSTAFVQENVKRSLEHDLSGRSDAAKLVETIRTDITHIRDLPDDVRSIAVAAYKGALQSLFWVAAGILVAAVVACALVPQHKLSDKNPAEQDEEEEDEGDD